MTPVTTTILFLVISTLFCSSYSSASSHLTDNSIRLNSEVQELPIDVIEKLKDVRDRGVEWLHDKKTREYGWPSGDTARVVIALASAVEDWPAKNDLVARLIVKQLEIELLEKLLRKDIDPVTPAKVAFFSLALSAACKDPHNFYGHNLVASLEKHHEDQDFPGYPETFGFSLTSLVACLAGSHLHKRQTKHLVQIAGDESTKPYSIDTRGTALMALECVRHRKKSELLSRHMREALETISEQQNEDGSFGNIHTTAIAIQALAASDDIDVNWNKTAGALALISLQEPNGSFLNNLYTTSDSVVAASALLNGFGLLGLRRGHCNSARRRYKNKDVTTTFLDAHQFITDGSNNDIHSTHGSLRPIIKILNDEPEATTGVRYNLSNKNDTDAQGTDSSISLTTTTTSIPSRFGSTTKSKPICVRYWLWIGPDPPTADRYNLTVHVSTNTTFFYVMQRAAELAPEFEFSSTVWPNGHYIHTISGHREQPIGYHYWLLYLLKGDPDPANPPSTTFVAPAGVDDLRVEDGQVYLFWYKKI